MRKHCADDEAVSMGLRAGVPKNSLATSNVGISTCPVTPVKQNGTATSNTGISKRSSKSALARVGVRSQPRTTLWHNIKVRFRLCTLTRAQSVPYNIMAQHQYSFPVVYFDICVQLLIVRACVNTAQTMKRLVWACVPEYRRTVWQLPTWESRNAARKSTVWQKKK